MMDRAMSPPASNAMMVAGIVANGSLFISATVTAPAIIAARNARGAVLPMLSKPEKRRFNIVRRIRACVVKVSAADKGIPAKPMIGVRSDDIITKATTWIAAAINGVRVF